MTPCTRVMELERFAPPAEGGPIRAAISSEFPVPRSFGLEVLEHSEAAIDLERVSPADGLPLTVGHSEINPLARELPIGRARNLRLEGDRLRADLDFDTDEQGAAARGKVERRVATDLSITYDIIERAPADAEGVVRVTRWRPKAVSLITLPADPSVGAGRSAELGHTEESPMHESTVLDQAVERNQTIRSDAATFARTAPALAEDLRALERAALDHTEVTVEEFRSRALRLLEGAEPLAAEPPPAESAPGPSLPGARFEVGAEHRDKIAEGVANVILERCGAEVDTVGNEFRGYSVIDMQREMLAAHGLNVRGMAPMAVAKAAIQMRAISPGTPAYATTDFPAVTENVITKLVHGGFAEAKTVYDLIASSTEVPDFKPFTIPQVSSISDLPIVAEGGTYQNLTQVDSKEGATLIKRGGLISWTWEAMVNDDARMLQETAAALGRSASRTRDKGFVAVLTSAQPTMNDGQPLFDSLVRTPPNSGTDALDLDGIIATRTRLSKMTDPNGELIDPELRIILVPEALRDTADNLAGSEYLPWPESSPGAQRVNTIRGTFTVASSARLGDDTDWFAFTRPGDHIEFANLRGTGGRPMIERDQGWDIDAMHYKARDPWVCYARDWRGCQRNVVA